MEKRTARALEATLAAHPLGDPEGALGYTRPRTYEELRALLSSATVRLPRQLREVALYVARNPGDFAVGNTVEISKRARVQPSTLVRFAQAFGFPGFSELQDIFKDYVKMNWPEARDRADPLAKAIAADNPDLRIIAGMVHTSIASLSRVPDGIDLASFDAVASGMADAETIYLIGSKRAFPVTMYMGIALSQLGIKNSLVDNFGSLGFEQLTFASASDAVLAISFSPYNSITPTLATRAAQSGAAVFAITDTIASPLILTASAWIGINEPDFGGFRSLAATLAVGMSLVLGVSRRRQEIKFGPGMSRRGST